MSDLIRRSDAIKALYKYSFVSKDVIEREINAIPSADRPRGEWIDLDDKWGFEGTFKCSACGELWSLIDGTPQDNGMNFCPNCGAKMKGADDE